MVAPSFQSMTIVSETYTKNGKLYIDVKNEKTGTIRSVRWYSDKEYARAYGNKSKDEAVAKLTPEQKKFYRPAAVRSLEVISKDPLTIKARVAASSLPKACVLIWQACGAAGIKSYQAP